MKNKNRTIFFIYVTGLLSIIATIFQSCKKNDTVISPNDNQKVLSKGYIPNIATYYELKADSNFFVGYNKVYINLYDSATRQAITDAHVYIFPQMTMNMSGMIKKHSCPFENPDHFDETKKNFPAAIIFTMPDDSNSKWEITLMVHNHINNKEGEVTFPIQVKNFIPSLVKMSKASDSSHLIVTMVSPKKAVVGENVIELTVHRKLNDNEFNPVEDLEITIEPTMPDMGHGSPNNVNPSHIEMGHYIGKVNFTMAGQWLIHVTIKKHNTILLDKVIFEIYI